MASADQYAAWIVANKDKRGTPEFETVAKAYKAAKTGIRIEPTTPDAAPVEPSVTQSDPAAKPLSTEQKILADYQAGLASNKQDWRNIIGGLVRGAGSLGSTIVAPGDMLADALFGDPKNGKSRNENRRANIDKGLTSLLGSNPDAGLYQVGKLGAEVAGTLGAGGAAGNMLLRVSPRAAPLATSLATGGFRTAPAGVQAATGTGNALTRIAGGAGSAALSAGMIDPSLVPTSAVIGGLIPGGTMVVGKAGQMVGKAAGAREVAPEVVDVARRARAEGLVIPPSEVRPTAVNQILEGTSGRTYVAQNASNKNIAPISKIAARSVGAKDLSGAELARVQKEANAAYSKVASQGRFKSDAAFRHEIDRAISPSEDMARDFPGVSSKAAEELAKSLKVNNDFGGQSTMEAIKRLREDAFLNKSALNDAEKKALGTAQSKMAEALENLVERNLVASGNKVLLTNFRTARETLAKLHNVKKAIDPATREIDAAQFAKLLRKNRNLSPDQKLLAEFAATFPSAAQKGSKVRGLPSLSRLDFAAGLLGGFSNPLAATAIAARPAVRELLLRSPVQNRLIPGTGNKLSELLRDERVANALAKSAAISYGQ